MHYGSLIDKEKFKNLDSADQKLYKYTADGFTHLGQNDVKTLAKRYPFEGGTVYRGLHFDSKEQYDKFKAEFKNAYVSEGFSSWTPSLSTAKDFAHTKKTYFMDYAIMMAHEAMQKSGDHMPGYGGVVLKTSVPANIGVDVSKSDFAKEDEVILPGGNYKTEIVFEAIPHHRKIVTKDDVKAAIKSKDLSAINFVEQSRSEHLDEKDHDDIFKIRSKNFLEASKDIKNLIHIKIDDDYSLSRFRSKEMELRISVYFPASNKNHSDELKSKLSTLADKVARELKKQIIAIMPEVEKQNVISLHLDGVHFLSQHSGIVNLALEPLKRYYSKLYHEINSLERTKLVKTPDDLYRFKEKIEKVVNAIVQLSKV